MRVNIKINITVFWSSILFPGDIIPVPATRNSMEQLSVAEGKLANVMSRLLGVDVFAKKLEMDEERFVPEGLGYKTDLFEEEEKVNRFVLLITLHTECFTEERWRRKWTGRRRGSDSRLSQETIKPHPGREEQKQERWKKALRRRSVSPTHGTCLVLWFCQLKKSFLPMEAPSLLYLCCVPHKSGQCQVCQWVSKVYFHNFSFYNHAMFVRASPWMCQQFLINLNHF